MEPHDHIEYEGKEYPLYFLDIPNEDDGTVQRAVSTESLARAALDENGLPLNPEAERIDDDIFFYVPEEIAEGNEDDIVDFITENL